MARKNKGKGGGNPNRPRFWGKHAVAAALDNPDRKVLKAWSTARSRGVHELPQGTAGDDGRRRPTLAGWCRTMRRTRAW